MRVDTAGKEWKYVVRNRGMEKAGGSFHPLRGSHPKRLVISI